jgi:hypothetical protein
MALSRSAGLLYVWSLTGPKMGKNADGSILNPAEKIREGYFEKVSEIVHAIGQAYLGFERGLKVLSCSSGR